MGNPLLPVEFIPFSGISGINWGLAEASESDFGKGWHYWRRQPHSPTPSPINPRIGHGS